MAAMETLSWATYVAVSTAHSDAQKIEADTLLSVLDAELSAENLDVAAGSRAQDAQPTPSMRTWA